MDNQLTKSENGPQNLIALAIEKGSSIEQLEKLLALKARYDEIEANKSFIAAMSNFQKEVPAIEKKKLVNYPSSKGGMVTYKYAELGEIDETIKEAMAANGLSKRWEITEEGDKLICTCIISHIDGHKELTSMSSIKDTTGGKNEIQSRASAISYLQRYTLIGALGLTTASEDDDANVTAPIVNSHSTSNNNNSYQEDTREWLTENKLKEGLERIRTGEEGVLESLIHEFRMKKAYRAELEAEVAKRKQNKEEKKDDKPFEIPGHWYAKMEKCKTKADVLAVYTAHKETIDAEPALQKLLKDTQASLATAKPKTSLSTPQTV